MTNIEIIKKLKSSTYINEDGEKETLTFEFGLTKDEVSYLSKKFPSNKIADELVEILKETRGWGGYGLDAVSFDRIEEFGLIELVPRSVALGHDGFGNYWLLEISNNGDLGKIFYVCHDPSVLVLYCDTINEFLVYLDEFYRDVENSYLNNIHDKIVFDIWNKKPNTFDINSFKKQNPNLEKYLINFDSENYIVADLRNLKNEEGFAWWGDYEIRSRLPDEFVWVLRKKEKGFFSKLFGK